MKDIENLRFRIDRIKSWRVALIWIFGGMLVLAATGVYWNKLVIPVMLQGLLMLIWVIDTIGIALFSMRENRLLRELIIEYHKEFGS